MRIERDPRGQGGFLVIGAVFLLVVLAALVGYLMTVSTTSQAASAADFNSARAYQAARSGMEVAAFQVLRNGTCAGSSIAFTGNLAGFTATITCTSNSINEGGASVTAYAITSTGCNDSACPNSTTASPTYAERRVSLTLTR
jgi:MSHA biogenesis protein MshP